MAGEIPGLGARTDRPQPAANPSLAGLQLKPEDWFLFSRIDGKLDIQSIFLLSPKSEAETIEMLKRLLDAGLIMLPAFGRPRTIPGVPGRPGIPVAEVTPQAGKLEFPKDWPTAFEDFSFDPALMEQDVSLDDLFKRQLLYIHDQMKKISYYQLFGVGSKASARDVKAKYLRLSKMFHPDRFFRQNLGSWRDILDEVFRKLNTAYQTLTDEAARSAYDATLQAASVRRPATLGLSSGGSGANTATGRTGSGPQPSQGLGRPNTMVGTGTGLQALLLEGKRLEREGQFAQALVVYEAALQKRRAAELLNRAAECLIRMRERLGQAEQYAREALDLEPQQARYWVALAYILELQSRRSEAITHYSHALNLDPEHRGAQERLRRLSGAP